jgi:hypothetical protein
MRKTLLSIAVALAAAAPAAHGQVPSGAAAVKASEPGRVTVADAVQVAATVQAIDKARRLVTLKGPQGNVFVVEAGPEVRNFDQIKVGDQVVARYVDALSLELKKGSGGIRERVEREVGSAAKPGERPGAAAGRRVTVVADVVAVDAARQSIRLRGVERTIDLKVKDRNQFALIKVGDQVEATFTEAIALSVEPAPAAPKAAPKK